MKKGLLLLVLILAICRLQAQIINTGWVYGGNGNQRATQSCIDKIGNRYQVINFQQSFDIDSAGTPITIQNNPNGYSQWAIAIIKYDTAGKYLYHVRFISNEGMADITLGFNSNNEVYIYCRFPQRDSLDMFDASGLLYKRLIPQYIGNGSYFEALLCKLNPNGQFIWVNTINRVNIPNLYNYGYWGTYNSLTVNHANEVIIHFNNDNDSLTDTLAITNTAGITTTALVSTKDILFKFSASGDLLSVVEPLKNRLSNIIHSSLIQNYNNDEYGYRAVTDGYNTYSINNINISTPDTFKCATPLPLKVGNNILLIKTNEQDSIVWARLIGVDSVYSGYLILNSYGLILDYDSVKQELVFGFTFTPAYFQFTNNPLLNKGNTDLDFYIAKLNTSGNITSENVYGGSGYDHLYSLTYNAITRQLILVGATNSYDFSIGNFLFPQNGYYHTFVACIDSSNNFYSAQMIKGGSWGGWLFNNSTMKIGYPITDLKGRTYFSGQFTDSILLPCRTLKATLDISQYGYYNTDGFVLMMGAQIPIDTNVCNKMVSPSGKYIWDSSYIYYDTLANSLGCDSVLLFRLKVLQTKSRLDSTVCKSMHSYSGKYTYTISGKYFDTIPNSKNCDSIITLNLTVLNSSIDSIAATFCKKYLSPSGKYTYTNSGKYFDTLTNSKGCDSIIILHLFSNKTTDSISVNVCDSFKSPSGKYVYSVSGIYVDTIKNFNNCDSIITINLTISKPKIKVAKSNDIDCTNKLATLLATGATKYIWSPNIALSNFQISNPIATPTTTITYTVVGTDTNGCKSLDSVIVNVTLSSNHQSIANVFTPNGDGINECFSIDSPTTIKSLNFYIFNRWGTQVFYSANPEGCWDGKNENNQPVSDGTYFYIIEGVSNCGLQFKLKGTVEVLR